MKGVIGVGLLLLGFTIGYLVLVGKLPSSGPLVKAPAGSITGGAVGSGPATPPTAPGVSPMGLPTMKHLHDVNSSLGGMQ